MLAAKGTNGILCISLFVLRFISTCKLRFCLQITRRLALVRNKNVCCTLVGLLDRIDSSCMANIKFSATQNDRFCLHTWGQLYFEYSKVTVSLFS